MKDDAFSTKWAMTLLKGISDTGKTEELDACLKGCADCHYVSCGRDKIAAEFKGNLDGFKEYLEETFGFIIQIDYNNRKIRYDVNKECCICPMIENYTGEIPTSLCECSRFFTQRMFSEVLGEATKTELLQSYLRDGKTCIYEISF